MNKLLIGTAAIALFASPALAAPIGVTVGGYYNSMVYNVDSDNSADYKDLSLQEDAEIIFKGKGKFNSGLEYGFQVQLEAASKDDQIDEHYIYVKVPLVRLKLALKTQLLSSLRLLHQNSWAGKPMITILKHGAKWLNTRNHCMTTIQAMRTKSTIIHLA